MARGRLISKTLSTSERWAQLHKVNKRLAEFAQSFFPLLIAHSDDFGRLPGDVFTVKHVVNPTSPRKDREFDLALCALTEVGLIKRYQVASKIYIEVVNFEDHQPGLHKRTTSKLPEPPADSGNFREFPSELKGTEENRTEEKRSQIKSSDQEPRADAPRSPRNLRMELRTLAEMRSHLLAACHSSIDDNPTIGDGQLAAELKDIAGHHLSVIDYGGDGITRIIDAVRGERARRSA